MAAHKTGGDVDAYCNKCKLVLAHVIIAMNGTRLVRVECKTCRSTHAYKKEASAPSTSRRTAAASRASRGILSAGDYDRAVEGHDMSQAQRYRISVNYAEGDVLDHGNFGLGLVTKLLGDSKIEVVFPPPAGLKVLVHARA